MQETRIQSLSREKPLKEEIATHSSIFAWETPRRDEPGRLQSLESQKSWIQLSNLTTMWIFHDETILIHLLIKLRKSRKEKHCMLASFSWIMKYALKTTFCLFVSFHSQSIVRNLTFFSCCKLTLPPLFYWRNWGTNMKWFTPNWLDSG